MDEAPFWSTSCEELLQKMQSAPDGLSSASAAKRLKQFGFNELHPVERSKGLWLLAAQFKSPLILLLVFAALLSLFLGAGLDASIILAIVVLSGLLGYFQEKGAEKALERLAKLVETRATVFRDGKPVEVAMKRVVPGDVALLSAGDLVPGDCMILESKLLFVNEGSLTGESAPAEKEQGTVPADAEIGARKNALFFGTTVISGTAKVLLVHTGKNTLFGDVAERIGRRAPETAFEIGVRRFGYFLLEVTLMLVIAIFAINIGLHRPMLEAFMFSLALAVGLTPQLLPAIISVNLSHGARKMAKRRVIVKRLASIENFGQMNILCADKTGTVTEGKLKLEKAVDPLGGESEACAEMAYLNAHFQSGYANPLDQAILAGEKKDLDGWEKVDEIPYDFVRKRISVVLRNQNESILIAKGALTEILDLCTEVEWRGGDREPIEGKRGEIERYFEDACRQGIRTLAVACGSGEEEKDLRLVGFLHFSDPVKQGVSEIIADLKKKGIHLKIISGDHFLVAAHVAEQIGLTHAHLIRGHELRSASHEALVKIAKDKNVFAEVEPAQKERIILALREAGHIVGYLGDGINDLSAMHSADVGISVEGGADAVKEAADFVLLDKDLSVLREGVEEGRRTFANTIKYVYMATSANFGNMFSMAGASLFLPFFPLLPKQILLTNFLTDFPEMAIGTDRVDPEIIHKPLRWDLKFIRRFMVVFGLISSVFDYATFAVLLFWLRASDRLFQTGWFIESVASATLVILIVRTRHSFFVSRPGKWLSIAIFAVVASLFILPQTSLGALFGFVPIPLWFYGVIFAIVMGYVATAEAAKRIFFARSWSK